MHKLFWRLLLTFAVLIVFGIGGTSALTFLSFTQLATRNRLQALERIEPTLAVALADFYVARGGTWRGAEQRLDDWLSSAGRLPGRTVGYVLFDQQGAIVARGGLAGIDYAAVRPADATAIRVGGQRVGALALLLAGVERTRPRIADGTPRRPIVSEESLDRQIRRTFVLVAVTIGLAMLALAVLLSRQISAPLAAMTRSAQRIAAGDHQARAPGSTIAEVAALARAFNQMADDLARADQQRRSLTADIAHELRTPLTIIKGKLEGMLDGVYPGTPEHLAPVLEETTLLERLIDDLRTLSLAEAGQLPLHRAVVPVAAVLGDVQRAFAAQAAQQQIALDVISDPTLPPIEVDAQRMQQVLGNLVSNSLRHTDAGGRVELRATAQNQRIQLAVRDTGVGIAPADLPQIFDRFWRGDKARSRTPHAARASTGLGLAIARQLVEAHGDRISAASQPGHGTTITIDLPAAS